MLLTLEVISANGDLLGGNRRKSIGPEGAKIGRALDNDWVINDKYISRLHAQVRYVNGAFYIEGLGRNPLALNDSGRTIPNSEPQILRSGDRIFLDEYEISVVIAAGTASAPVQRDPFNVEETARTTAPAKSWTMGIVDAGIADAGSGDSSSLDPLAALGGPAPRREPPLVPVNIHQGSVLENSYRAPAPVTPHASASPASPSMGGGSRIPDSWDRSGFTQLGEPQPPAAPAPRRPAAPMPQVSGNAAIGAVPAASGGGSIPDTWDKARMTRVDAPVQPAVPPPMSSKAPPVWPVPPQPSQRTAPGVTQNPAPGTRGIGERTRQPAPPATIQQDHDYAPTMRAPAERPAPAAASPASVPAGAFSLEELLAAAGVPSTNMNAEMAGELGQVLRIVVQGVMEVLQSRAEIKSQLRMSMTRMQASENNPLKFSPNVEAALHTLLVERNRGYLPTTRAFQEALTDIRNHQIAVLQGIRSAFDAMLEHFDPEKLEEELEKQSKRGSLLNLGGKGRFRDYYVEQYASMTKDPDESFKRLFGEYFAQAYEEQMDRLKATGRTVGG